MHNFWLYQVHEKQSISQIAKRTPISEFEFRFIGLPEIREKSEPLLYPAAIFDGCLVVIGALLVATR
jgi:hypothetical protein